MFNKIIISSLIDIKAALKKINVLQIFNYLNIEVRPNKDGYSVIGNNKYIVFKNIKNDIECLDIANLNLNYKITGYDLIINYLDLTQVDSLMDLFEEISSSKIDVDDSLYRQYEKKTILNAYFGINKELPKKEMHQLIANSIFINKNNTLSLSLFDTNQQSVIDMLEFGKNYVKSIIGNPYACLKYKLENLPLKNCINFVFQPKYLITSNASEFINTPYILLNNGVTQSEIDKILFNEVSTDKEVLKKIKINLVVGPYDDMIGTIQLLHYFLNSMIDYAHFNIEVKETYINIAISWKVAEGMTKELRLALSNSLKIEIHNNIFERYYTKVLGNTNYSENIDLLFDRIHKIEKRQSYINKKKDLVLYRFSINSLSLYEYARHMIKVFNLENVSIQNRLKQ